MAMPGILYLVSKEVVDAKPKGPHRLSKRQYAYRYHRKRIPRPKEMTSSEWRMRVVQITSERDAVHGELTALKRKVLELEIQLSERNADLTQLLERDAQLVVLTKKVTELTHQLSVQDAELVALRTHKIETEELEIQLSKRNEELAQMHMKNADLTNLSADWARTTEEVRRLQQEVVWERNRRLHLEGAESNERDVIKQLRSCSRFVKQLHQAGKLSPGIAAQLRREMLPWHMRP